MCYISKLSTDYLNHKFIMNYIYTPFEIATLTNVKTNYIYTSRIVYHKINANYFFFLVLTNV